MLQTLSPTFQPRPVGSSAEQEVAERPSLVPNSVHGDVEPGRRGILANMDAFCRRKNRWEEDIGGVDYGEAADLINVSPQER